MARSLREAARSYRGRATAESGRRGHLREPEETRAGGVAATEVSPVFRLEGVTKRFGGVVAVEDVAFDLQPGEVHALVGENGAGKSTLMKIVDGLYGPDEGTLEVGGEAASFSSPREAEASGIAMIPQELDLFPELSVAENLFVGRKRPRTGWGGLDWETMRGEARKRLDDLGVEPLARLASHGFPVQAAPAGTGSLAAHEQILGHAELGEQVELLRDHGYA